MIFLQLFLTFLKAGAFTFGGGYAMISIISASVLSYGWMTEEELLSFLAVETVIPGPIAVNMATYVGYEQGGFLGALIATIGVVLPSFVIILIIASLLKNLMKYAGVQAFLGGMHPSISGLILATAATMGLKIFFGLKTVESALHFDIKSIGVMALVVAISLTWKKIKKKEISPIILIVVSGVMGIILFL
ncbi:MAG: chromate transporter [Eubacteriaceae bacterium]|nr:chromate transporter [Eubacteriaceae bacterium]